MSRIATIAAISSSRAVDQGTPDRVITSALAQNSITVDNGTAFGSLTLPSQVVFTLDDATSIPLNVTWAQGSYNASVAGVYTLSGTPTLVPTVTNPVSIVATINVTVNPALAFDVYVSPSGNDANSGLSVGLPKLTIAAAITTAQGLGGQRTIKAAAGTFTLPAYTSFPVNISFVGDGVDSTIINGIEALNHTFVPFLYAFDKSLIQLTSGSFTAGNQTLRDFTLDCSKLSNSSTRGMHGGIYVLNRSNVVLSNIKVRKCGFVGIYVDEVTSSRITGCNLTDCSYGSSAFATGCIMWGDCTDLEIDNNTINEGFGNGAKGFDSETESPTNYVVTRLKFHHNNVSVYPVGQWAGGGAPNIAVEQWGAVARNCEFYSNYVDNNMSLVKNQPATDGIQTVRVYDNVFDMLTRANGAGYCMELSVNYAEVDHNYMIGGSNATIANYQGTSYPIYGNWSIHHNTIRAAQATFPSSTIRTQNRAMRDVNFYNNVVHVLPGQNQQWIGFACYGNEVSTNINCKNNIFLDESTANSQYGENRLAQFAGGAQNFIVQTNFFFGVPVGSVGGGTYTNNFTTNPQLTKTGTAPDPYYRPLPGSPVIEAGVNVGLPFGGAAPTIGVYELTDPAESGDIVSVSAYPARSIVTGVEWSTLLATLPTTATVTLDDASEVILSVVWAQGSYDPNTEDTYVLDGALTLISGVTNTGNIVANISVTTTDAVVYFADSFNRSSLGSNYTIQGNVTATLDDTDMIMGITGGGGVDTDRIILNTFDTDIDNFRVITVFKPTQVNSISYGIGIGIFNAINPDPNLGVYCQFSTSTGLSAGRAAINTGDGSLSNTFINRVNTPTVLSIVQDRRYILIFEREIIGPDAMFTVTVMDTVTDQSITRSWTELGAGSMAYRSTQKIAIVQSGGEKRVEDFTVYDLDVLPPPEGTLPENTVLPAISGTTEVGQILSVTTGTWLGSGITYTYQWKRDGVSIGSATNNTYTLVEADAFNPITCTVTATNSAGAVDATSSATSDVRYIVLRESFNSLTNWTEEDIGGNQIVATVLNPGVSITGNSFLRAARNIKYNTPLGTSVKSFKITATLYFTGTATRGLAFGTKNTVNPDANRFFTGTLSFNTGKTQIWGGDGSTSNNEEQSQKGSDSAGTLASVTASTDYVVIFERSYSGSGDATYTCTAYKASDPGTTVSTQYVSTGAPEQAFYTTTGWIIAAIASGTANVVKNIEVERLN